MIALLVPEISPGVGFCDEDEEDEDGRIGYSSSWMIGFGMVIFLLNDNDDTCIELNASNVY